MIDVQDYLMFADSPLTLIGGNDSFTKLLLHMDGTNGSTTFTDSSSLATTVTPLGSTNITTSNFKFATGAGTFGGTGYGLSFPNSANYEVGAGDFTVDLWEYCTDASIASNNDALYSDFNAAGTDYSLTIYHLNSGVYVNIKFTDLTSININSTPITLSSWTHVAVVRSGTTVTLYVNGVSAGTASAGANTVQNCVATARWIGKQGDFVGNYFAGQLDEFRFSKGIARWTSNFTPPTMAYS